MDTAEDPRQALTVAADLLIAQEEIRYFQLGEWDYKVWGIHHEVKGVNRWYETKEEAAELWIQLKIQGKI